MLRAVDHHPAAELRISPRDYLEQGYAFAYAHDSAYGGRLDVALLEEAALAADLFEWGEGE